MTAQATMSPEAAEQLRRQLEGDAAAWQQRKAEGKDEVGLLDEVQLKELAAMTEDARRELALSEGAEAFVAASRAVASRGWSGTRVTGTILAIVLMLMLLATPIILLFIVVLSAAVIQFINR